MKIVSRDLDIDIIQLSLDPGQAPSAHARAGRLPSLRTVRACTGMCSSLSCVYNKYRFSISRYLDIDIIKLR
jgi:hypothetical protein